MSSSKEEDSGVAVVASTQAVNATTQPKPCPGDFARQLAGHAGFDALARRETPPPSYATPPPRYSRLAQPRLTLQIPEHVVEIEDLSVLNPVTAVVPDSIAIESVESSPVEAPDPHVQTASIASRIRTKLRQRSVGLRERIRRSNTSSQSSSTAASPSDSSTLNLFELDSAESSAIPTRELGIIQELDGQPIQSSTASSRWASRVWRTERQEQRRNMAVPSSSIVPTPQRGLSSSSPRQRLGPVLSLDATELSDRLQTLRHQRPQHGAEIFISPTSPTSHSQDQASWQPSTLVRSNAITESIAPRQDLLSPISPVVSGPPVTPTLDGRLDRLPRLTTAPSPATNHDVGLHRRRSVAEADSGKELVTSLLNMSGRLDRPLSTPHWGRPQTHNRCNEPETRRQADEFFGVPSTASGNQTIATSSIPRSRRSDEIAASTLLVEAVCELVLTSVTRAGTLLNANRSAPKTPEHHVRVRWRCSCGEDLYDDFIEKRPGAAAELEAHLNKVPSGAVYSPGSSNPTSGVDSVFSPMDGLSPLSPVSEWSSPSSASPQKSAWQDQTTFTQRLSRSQSYRSPVRPYSNNLWLYTCVNEGKGTTRLRHLDVSALKVSSDRDLALALSSAYNQMNKNWLKLRGLLGIRFVQFELHRNRFVDISHSSATFHGNEGCDYEFQAHDLNPPVGTNYLTHLFKHPEDFDDEFVAYSKAPKRRERLDMGRGWGIELVEGYTVQKVCSALLALLVLGSMAFTVAYLTKDLQDALKVAGTVTAIAGLALVSVQ